MAQAVDRQFQVSHATSFMRYSEHYARLRSSLVATEAPRVLVFGCSTGAELNTIRHFWPKAAVYGCDIDDEVIAEARAEAPFADIFLSDEAAIRDRGPFDLIAANSVLCRHPFPKEGYADLLPFSMFEHYVNFLVSALAEGGHLFLYNTNYFVDDLDIAADLTPVILPEGWSGGFVPRVDTAGTVVAHPTILNQRLCRFVMTGGFDPMDRMRAAIFARGAGTTRVITDPAVIDCQALQPAAELMLPDPSHPKAFEPCFLDFRAREGLLRMLFLHNPHAGGWVLHGTFLDPSAP